MKKKLVMRKWFENVILFIGGMALLVAMSECDDMLIFITSHLIAILVLSVVGCMLMFYGRESDE